MCTDCMLNVYKDGFVVIQEDSFITIVVIKVDSFYVCQALCQKIKSSSPCMKNIGKLQNTKIQKRQNNNNLDTFLKLDL